MKELLAESKVESFSSIGSKKSSYKKPSLRVLSAEEQECSRVMQEYIAYMQSLGAEPNQKSFEAYLISGGSPRSASN